MEYAKFSVAGKSFYKQTEEELHKVRSIVQSIDPLGEHFKKAMTYNTTMIAERIVANHPEYQLRILFDATPADSVNAEETVKAYPDTPLMQGLAMRTVRNIIIDDQLVAQYDSTYNVLYILFDLVGKDGWVEYFQKIITELNKFVLVGIQSKSDWANEDRREELLKLIMQDTGRSRERKVADLKDSVGRAKRNAHQYEQEVVNAYKAMQKHMKDLEELLASNFDPSEKYTKELNLILADKKVEKVSIDDNKWINVKTVPLTINASGGTRHVGGSFTIKFRPGNTDIKITSDVRRKSYWSNEDPHPHVDGNRGEACWGNTSTTLGQLISQEEFYAYITIIINFLESANEDDQAGACVRNWDLIEEDGSVTPASESDHDDEDEAYETCSCCEDRVADTYDVYDEVDEDGCAGSIRFVCDACRAEHYYYDEEAEEYLSNDCQGWNE